MNTKFFTGLTLAAALLIGGPLFARDHGGGGGGGGRSAAFVNSGGGRSASFAGSRRSSFAFGGSRRDYGYGGRRYGYGRGYGYGFYGYPYYYSGNPYYGYGGYDDEPAYTVYGSSYPESATAGSVSVQVQRELACDGYYHGPIDGVVGPVTRAAIAAFQRDNGLRPTGAINGHLLDAMDLQ